MKKTIKFVLFGIWFLVSTLGGLFGLLEEYLSDLAQTIERKIL